MPNANARIRPIRAVAAALAALALALLPVLPAAAATSSTGGPEDFTFDSFHADYVLGLTDDGRSKVAVTETLVAQFPDFDQNHGIRRVIPAVYDGHPVRIDVTSVKDATGRDWNYETSFDDENMTLQIGDGDRYVHGEQTFVIAYTMQNVTRYFDDTGDDEFYWDTNGLLWPQPFGEVSATVTLEDGLAGKLQSTDCYYGYDGESNPCDISAVDQTVTAGVRDLGPYQNMSIVLGFPAGTFEPADFSIFDYLPLGGIIGIGAALAAMVSALILRFTALRDAPGTGIVVAQYEPPDGIDPFLAANIVKAPKRGMAAAIMDLAVKRKLRIVEREGTGLFGGTDFGVQQVDDATAGLDDTEITVLSALFSPVGGRFFSLRTPGLITLRSATPEPTPASDVRWLTKNDTVLGRQVVALTKAAAAEAQQLKLRRKGGGPAALLIAALIVVSGIAFLATSTFSQTGAAITVGVIGVNAVIWIGIGLIAVVAGRKPLTAEGAKLKEHLLGLKEYIRLAEADRLQMLQSVTGAERMPLKGASTDAGSVVKVYEKLLPYAVLFGLEKEWAGELAKYYDQNPPDWYSGSSVSSFSAGAFAATVGSLSSSVSTSYSGSSSSSSSGGSGGGGSSGGGGGGGGGGGW
jgi:uncharacterized membrane protein YgcG